MRIECSVENIFAIKFDETELRIVDNYTQWILLNFFL